MSTPDTEVNWKSIRAVQDEITRWADEQFPGRTDHQTVFKLMVHEIPELMTHKKEQGTEDIGTELADCFILLMDLASMWEVDLVKAIRDKMRINYQRTWERDAHGIMQHVKMPPPRPEAPTQLLGLKCPKCPGATVIMSAPLNSLYMYKCENCGEEFDDDIPF